MEENAASLARLRLFLAPHSSAEKDDHEGHEAAHAHDTEKHDQVHHVEQEHSPSALEITATPEAAQALDDAVPVPEESNNDIAPQSNGHVAPEIKVDGDEYRVTEHIDQGTIAATGAAASVCPISSSTREFARVKYLLQVG